MKLSLAIFLTLLASAAVILLGVSSYGWTVEGLQATTRFSGRLSLVIFSLIFLLHPGKKETLALILSPHYFLIFAIAHGIHLIELLSYVILSGIPLVPYRLAGGFMAYAMIFLMPYFQLLANENKVSEGRFLSLGYVYLFYVWFIFFMTYLSRVNGTFPNAGGNYSEHVGLMVFVNVLLGVKIVQVLMRNTSKR